MSSPASTSGPSQDKFLKVDDVCDRLKQYELGQYVSLHIHKCDLCIGIYFMTVHKASHACVCVSLRDMCAGNFRHGVNI
jgi:hypothetical protein